MSSVLRRHDLFASAVQIASTRHTGVAFIFGAAAFSAANAWLSMHHAKHRASGGDEYGDSMGFNDMSCLSARGSRSARSPAAAMKPLVERRDIRYIASSTASKRLASLQSSVVDLPPPQVLGRHTSLG